MANEHNLRPSEYKLSQEEAKKGGKKSGEARRKKRDLRERMQLLMEQSADPRVASHMAKTGVEIHDNADVLVAGIMKGVLKGDTKSINMAIELSGNNVKEEHRRELQEIEKRKAQLEADMLELEKQRKQLWLDAVTGRDQPELPDDGFLEALSGTAEEDWSNEVL